jgi:poly(glycerol-phosphate) alpha-glucosyltransferase
MIKSAHLAESVSRRAGGLFEAILRLVQAYDAKQTNVKVFGLRDEFTETDLKAWNPIAVEAYQPGWPPAIGPSRELKKALFAFHPDIVHTHGLWRYPSIAAANYARITKRPYLISPHGMLDPWALQNSRWKKRLAAALFENAHLRGARCFRALCESEARSIRALGLKNPVAIIPNGITLPEQSVVKTEKFEAPWANHVVPGGKILLFLSRIHPKKGLVNLLKAWAQVRKAATAHHESRNWILAIAGWDQGGHESELKRLCADLRLAALDVRDKTASQSSACPVIFLGPQFNDAKHICYQSSDAFVLPSLSEGLPMVVLEAWAYGKPVLMTPECNLPEGFRAEAAICAAASVWGLESGLNELFRFTEADRTAMGCRGRRLVEEHFTWDRVGEQMGEVYQWILGGGQRPASIVDA